MEIENGEEEERIWMETIEMVRMDFKYIGYKDNLSDYFLLLRIFKQIYQEVKVLRRICEEGGGDLYAWSAPQGWHKELFFRFLSIRFSLFKPKNCCKAFPDIGLLLNNYREREEML